MTTGIPILLVAWLQLLLTAGDHGESRIRISILLITYNNSQTSKCDSYSMCDYIFELCLDNTYVTRQNVCHYSSWTFNTEEDTDVVHFGDEVDGFKNPLIRDLTVVPLPNYLWLLVKVNDDDYWNDDKIDSLEGSIDLGFPWKEKQYVLGTGIESRLTFNVSISCAPFYYGDRCDTFCPPPAEDNYVCNQTTGQKICNNGWVGQNCATRFNVCDHVDCSPGEECVILNQGRPTCQCFQDCPTNVPSEATRTLNAESVLTEDEKDNENEEDSKEIGYLLVWILVPVLVTVVIVICIILLIIWLYLSRKRRKNGQKRWSNPFFWYSIRRKSKPNVYENSSRAPSTLTESSAIPGYSEVRINRGGSWNDPFRISQPDTGNLPYCPNGEANPELPEDQYGYYCSIKETIPEEDLKQMEDEPNQHGMLAKMDSDTMIIENSLYKVDDPNKTEALHRKDSDTLMMENSLYKGYEPDQYAMVKRKDSDTLMRENSLYNSRDGMDKAKKLQLARQESETRIIENILYEEGGSNSVIDPGQDI